ncbi:MAG: hypothetical protein AAFU55_14930, partial [Pseudomonadota bacterium]
AALVDDDPLWEIVKDEYESIWPLLSKAEREGGVDEGVLAQARSIKDRHAKLEDMLRPEQPAEKPAPIDRETPEEASDEAMTLIEAAAAEMEGVEAIAPASPAFLRHTHDQVKRNREDGIGDASEDGAVGRRKRLTRSIVTAAGFVAAVLTIGQAALPAAVVARLGQLWREMIGLIFS